MFVIKGYKIPKLSLKKTEEVIAKAKSEIMKIAERHYRNLLSTELENLIDGIILGTEPEPVDISLFDFAVNRLNQRIATASARKVNTEYNMTASANLFSYKNDTYIELVALTELYDRVFDEIPGVENYGVRLQETFIPEDDPKADVWKNIIEKYKTESTFVIRLYPVYQMTQPSFEQLSFHSVKERAEKLARHYLTNVLLSAYSGGEQIPPHKLMEYMDCALLRASDEALVSVLEEKEKQLMTTLLEITSDIIYHTKTSA